MIRVEIDTRAVELALEGLLRRTGDLSPALRVMGEGLVESVQQRFAEGTGPEGERWAENSAVTIARKGRNQPLVQSGTLGHQIHYQLDGRDTLVVGSSMEYAAMQQFGGTKEQFPQLWGDIPARPFLGLSAEDEAMIRAVVMEFIES